MGIRQARDIGRAKTAFQLLMAAAVANLTYLAATASQGQPTDPQLSAVGLVSVLLGLLVVVLSRDLGPGWPTRTPNPGRLPRTTSPGRLPTRLPTSFALPGCRPGF